MKLILAHTLDIQDLGTPKSLGHYLIKVADCSRDTIEKTLAKDKKNRIPGTPCIFFDDCLFTRLLDTIIKHTVEQARMKITSDIRKLMLLVILLELHGS